MSDVQIGRGPLPPVGGQKFECDDNFLPPAPPKGGSKGGAEYVRDELCHAWERPEQRSPRQVPNGKRLIDCRTPVPGRPSMPAPRVEQRAAEKCAPKVCEPSQRDGSARWTTVTVRPGDTLAKIAREYGTTWQAIFDANTGEVCDPNLIRPGQRLRVPTCEVRQQECLPAPPKADCPPPAPKPIPAPPKNDCPPPAKNDCLPAPVPAPAPLPPAPGVGIGGNGGIDAAGVLNIIGGITAGIAGSFNGGFGLNAGFNGGMSGGFNGGFNGPMPMPMPMRPMPMSIPITGPVQGPVQMTPVQNPVQVPIAGPPQKF